MLGTPATCAGIDGHHQRGGQRIAARRGCSAATVSSGRTICPRRAPPGTGCDPLARHLEFGVGADVGRGGGDGGAECGRKRAARLSARASGTRTDLAVEAVELARVLQEGAIAALAHGFENRRAPRLRLPRTRAARRASRRPASLLSMIRITGRFCSADIPRCPGRPPFSAAE